MDIDIKKLPCFTVYNVLPNGKCSCPDANCGSIGKHPKEKGHLQTKGYPDTKDFIHNNYGVPTGSISKIVIVDVDVQNGGMATFDKLEKDKGTLDATWTLDTPSGGFHYYYSIPDDIEFSISTQHDFYGPGIDILAEGAFAVMEGSNHVKGIYKWREGEGPADDVVLETIPQYLLDMFEEHENKKALQTLRVGECHVDAHTLNEISLCLKHLSSQARPQWLEVGMALQSIGNQGDKPFQIWKQWSIANSKAGTWRERDVHTWQSFSSSKGINHARIFWLANEAGIHPSKYKIMIVNEQLDKDLDKMADNFEKLRLAPVIDMQPRIPKPTVYPKTEIPPGIAGDIVRLLHERLEQTTPLHVIITMVTQILPSAVFHGLICTPESLGSISAYNLIIGQQGSGKTDAINNINLMTRFILASDNTKSLGLAPWPASGGALLKSFAANNPMVITDDELLTKLHSVYQKDRRGDGLLGMILSCWSATQESVLIGQIAQDQDYNQATVDSPALTMFGGGVTAQWKKLSADEEFMSRGIGTRVEVTEWGKLIIPTKPRINRRLRINGELEELLTRQKDLLKFLRADAKINRKNRKEVGCCEEVRAMIFQCEVENKTKANLRDESDSRNETRIAELSWRAATRLAILDASVSANGKVLNGLIITPEHMAWAMDYVTNRFAIAEQTAQEDNSDEGKFEEAVMRLLAKNKKLKTTLSEISRKTGRRSGLKAHERKLVLDEMLASKQIITFDSGFYLPQHNPQGNKKR